MKLYASVLWLCLAGVLYAEAPSAVPVAAALARHQVTATVTAAGRDSLVVKLHNSTAQPVTIEVPAGTIAKEVPGAGRTVVLRAGTASLPAGESAELSLPAAALSIGQSASPAVLILTQEAEPKLAGLLTWLATQPDVPKSTAQLAVFCFLENIDFAAWEKFLAVDRPDSAAAGPTPADITQAVDVLGVLRKIAPEQTFALASDNGLKLRALRNPWCRAKAAQLYGLDAGDGGVAPDLGQLLHTKPGDNCPICRQRALMQQAGNDL